ncbi:MAG: hypothetical protein Q9219_002832 [cf. Caloplaca sp. 3 TL-2023]
MDPLSVIASVLGIVSVTVESSKALFELIDTVRSAPNEIQNISRDTQAFYSVIFSLEASLKEPRVATAIAEDLGLTALVENLREPLGNCTNALGQLMVKIQAFIRPLDGERKRFSGNDLKWYWGRREIVDLAARVEATKATLNMGFTAIGALCSVKLSAAGNNVPSMPIRRGSGDTDAGFALRRYVEEKETASRYASSMSPPSPPITAFDQTTLQSDGSRTSAGPDLRKVKRLLRAQNSRDALLTAARQGDSIAVELALAEGADVNAKGPEGTAAVHIATLHGCTDIVELLIACNADVNIQTTPQGDREQRKFQGRRTALHWAADKGFEDIARLLIDNGAEIDAKNYSGRTPLQEAVKTANIGFGVTRLLLERGASIAIYDDEGWTPLHQAAFGGNSTLIETLVEKGCDIEAQTSDSTFWNSSRFCRATPLFLAAGSGREAAVRTLMAHGANIRCRNLAREMPIHVASWRGFATIVRIMLEAGVGIEEKDFQVDETPLLKAACMGKVNVLRLLVSRGANLDAESRLGRNALQFAQLRLKEGNEDAVRYLQGVYEKRKQVGHAANEEWRRSTPEMLRRSITESLDPEPLERTGADDFLKRSQESSVGGSPRETEQSPKQELVANIEAESNPDLKECDPINFAPLTDQTMSYARA